jgi:hypothetical protein
VQILPGPIIESIEVKVDERDKERDWLKDRQRLFLSAQDLS